MSRAGLRCVGDAAAAGSRCLCETAVSEMTCPEPVRAASATRQRWVPRRRCGTSRHGPPMVSRRTGEGVGSRDRRQLPAVQPGAETDGGGARLRLSAERTDTADGAASWGDASRQTGGRTARTGRQMNRTTSGRWGRMVKRTDRGWMDG